MITVLFALALAHIVVKNSVSLTDGTLPRLCISFRSLLFQFRHPCTRRATRPSPFNLVVREFARRLFAAPIDRAFSPPFFFCFSLRDINVSTSHRRYDFQAPISRSRVQIVDHRIDGDQRIIANRNAFPFAQNTTPTLYVVAIARALVPSRIFEIRKREFHHSNHRKVCGFNP